MIASSANDTLPLRFTRPMLSNEQPQQDDDDQQQEPLATFQSKPDTKVDGSNPMLAGPDSLRRSDVDYVGKLSAISGLLGSISNESRGPRELHSQDDTTRETLSSPQLKPETKVDGSNPMLAGPESLRRSGVDTLTIQLGGSTVAPQGTVGRLPCRKPDVQLVVENLIGRDSKDLVEYIENDDLGSFIGMPALATNGEVDALAECELVSGTGRDTRIGEEFEDGNDVVCIAD